MSNIEFHHLTKKYGNVTALNDISGTIQKGKRTVILGPSGAGKTTLLRILAGLEIPDEGVLKCQGRVAMIFQSAALFPHTRVRENITYGLRKLGWSKTEIQLAAEKVAKTLKIDHLMNRFPGSLSGGEKQRVGIARALIRNPDILLLDEPFASLDQRLREELQSGLLQMQKQTKMTMIMISHDQQEALAFGDEIIIMHAGEIEEVNTPENIYQNPESLFTASFVGNPAMNFFHGTLRQNTLSIGPHDFPLFSNDEGNVTIGMRPENFVIREDGFLQCTVYETSHFQNQYAIKGISDMGHLVFLSSSQLLEGMIIHLDVHPKDFHIFDEYGKRIHGGIRQIFH